MKKIGVSPNIAFVSTQWNFILDAVANNMGVVLCPYYIYSKYKNPRLAYVRMKSDQAYRQIGIVTKKNEYRTRACICFLDYATELSHYDGITERLLVPEK